MTKSKREGRAVSIPSGLAAGAAVSIAATVVISFVGAQLILNEVMTQDRIGYCSMTALLSGTILGAVTASGKIRHRKLLICMLSGGVYFCLLLAATALFFGGQYEGFLITFLTVLMGTVAAALMTSREGKGKRKRIRKK